MHCAGMMPAQVGSEAAAPARACCAVDRRGRPGCACPWRTQRCVGLVPRGMFGVKNIALDAARPGIELIEEALRFLGDAHQLSVTDAGLGLGQQPFQRHPATICLPPVYTLDAVRTHLMRAEQFEIEFVPHLDVIMVALAIAAGLD